MFTWGGWAKAFYFACIYYAVKYFLTNTYFAGVFGVIFLFLEDV